MMNTLGKFAAVAALFGAVPTIAAAAPGQVTLTGDVKLEKTVMVDGKPQLVLDDPKVVVPGDRLAFATLYANNGGDAVQNLVVTNPVPSAVVVADDSAAALQVSVDGGQNFGNLASLQIKGEAGAPRPALAADITHIRWTIATIPPGGSGSVGYHGIVR